MTDLAELTNLTLEPHLPRRRVVPTLAIGLFGGVALGVIARAWMRLIAEDPAFTWSGTLFIVIGFTVFGFFQSIAALARARATRRWTLTIARTVGVIGLLPLFVAAGGIMFPTVVCGGLGIARRDWPKPLRLVLLLAATFPVVFVGSDLVNSFGMSLRTLAGFVALVAIYGTIVAATRFTFAPRADGRRLNRWVRYVLLAVLGLVVVFFEVGLFMQ